MRDEGTATATTDQHVVASTTIKSVLTLAAVQVVNSAYATKIVTLLMPTENVGAVIA